MLSQLKLGQRLALAFGMLVVLLLGLAGVAAMGMKSIGGNVAYFTENIVPSFELTHKAVGRLDDRRRLEYRHIASSTAEDKARDEAELAAADKAFDEAMAKYLQSLVSDDTDRRLAQGFLAAAQAHRTHWDKVRKLSLQAVEDPTQSLLASTALLGESNTAYTQAAKAGDEWFEYQAKLAADGAQAAGRDQTTAQLALAVGTGLGIVLAVAAALLITRSVVQPMRQAVDAASRVAQGDLTQPIAAHGKDEVAELLHALSDMQASLARVVGQVRTNAEGVSTASVQIAQGNQDLSQRTEEQAGALQQTAATMSELGQMVGHNADSAAQADQLSQGAATTAGRGGEVVAQVVESMREINDSSRRIADIIGTIDGIAFQTNILALNAAVEAARAGEQGRGFAVVATEVRTLAQRSAEAAREIKSLITRSVEQVERGSALVDQAGATMTEIVSSVRRVSDIVGEISAASSTQSQGVQQVGHAVGQMDQATQQNAALVEESAAAAESLKQQAQHLVQAMAVFKV